MKHTPKKSLGQNFLKSKVLVERIAKAAKITNLDEVLEIGPGRGILTRALLDTGAKVIAVEKDFELISFLQEKFKKEINEGKLELVSEDILKMSPENLKLKTNYKLVANIPYYITGEIIRKFLEDQRKPSSMTLLLQKEVAKRIVASDKKESILSISVKAFGTPKIIEIVKKEMFTPKPKVDSAVIHISEISNSNFKNKEEGNKFFTIVKAGFAHKRKVLVSNLSQIEKKEEIIKVFDHLRIPLKARAEDLALSNWIDLGQSL